MIVELALILLAVLLLPVLVRRVERHIEIFFLAAGILTAAVSGQLNLSLLKDAVTAPIEITLAVLVFGAAMELARPLLDRSVARLSAAISARWFLFILIVVLGLLSSIITAVIAALALVETAALMRLKRESEIAAVVLACFAIGLGAALTPVGEPLSTLAIAALHADFWYLARLIGPWVIAGIAIVALASLAVPLEHRAADMRGAGGQSWTAVVVRAVKIYVFVAGLVALSWGMRPMVDAYIGRLPISALFWLNGISAVVDNATLAAAEIGPALGPAQQRAILMGLLISGGLLIPGNIPNIVAAGRLGITSREWARIGLLIGVPLMVLCFAALCLVF